MKNEMIVTRPAAYIGRMSGIVTVPSDHDPAKEQLPVIVFLHGAGEVGDGSEQAVQKVKAHGIPKLFGADADYGGLRVITAHHDGMDANTMRQMGDFLRDKDETVVAVLASVNG